MMAEAQHEQIIKLGKLLAEEQRLGCEDRIAFQGLDYFIQNWLVESESASVMSIPAVRQSLALLADYGSLPIATRQERIALALELLRDLFRTPRTDTEAPPAPPTKRGQKTSTPGLSLKLNTPIKELPEVGRNVALAFKRLGLHTVEDLLHHFPHRYDDYSSQNCIANLAVGEVGTVVGVVAEVRTFPLKRPGSMGIDLLFQDQSGSMKVVFFGNQWLLKQFPVGRKLVLSGKVKVSQRGMLEMTRPDWEPYTEDELIHTGRLVPVHPLTRGLHERNARKIIKMVVDHAAPLVEDFLPSVVRERANLLTLPEALQQIHFPDNQDMLARARLRLGFDEFLLIQIGVVQRKMLWQGELGYAMTISEEVHTNLLAQLPFQLTGAQTHAIKEIFSDMQRHVPMARLLQGDVGSGKTMVAAAALSQAIANGMQGAMMAPTEILAEQHYHGLRKLLGGVRVPRQQETASGKGQSNEGDGISEEHRARLNEIKQLLGMTPEDDMGGEGMRVALLTGSLGKKERRRVLEAIANGDVDLIIGTHALITEGVQYQELGLVCVDEQHRFGVEQRERLKQKGFNPHMLVMTATPIPRSLTLTIYGELDTSILDEMPPGRQLIKTRWITRSERHKAYQHIRKEVDKGRQVFVICPLVEESEKVDLPSAEETHQLLQNEIFPDLRVAIIHGRLLPREKDQVMRAFRDHQHDILVATAVVEVGIDVPNATTIMIDGAERFGLAQLHQFRGRVGRGTHQSYCILVSDLENEVTTQRLEAMEKTHDGFELAEIDLQLRGPGEFLGKRQSGTPDLKIARLADSHLLYRARVEAQTILQDDPHLNQPDHALLREKVRVFWEKAEGAS